MSRGARDIRAARGPVRGRPMRRPGMGLAACVCGALLGGSPAFAAGVHATVVPGVSSASPGDTVVVQLVVPVADAAFNAFDAVLRFDSTRLQFVPASSLTQQIGPLMAGPCSNFFHLFTAHPDSLEIHLGMLCASQSVAGPGVLYQVRFRVMPAAGPTPIEWGVGTGFYAAGFRVRPVDVVSGSLQISGVTEVGPGGTAARDFTLETPRPNPRRGSGGVTLGFWLPGPQRIRFDIYDAQGRRVASRDAERLSAGRGSFTWEGLRLSPGRYTVRMTSGAGARSERSWIVLR